MRLFGSVKGKSVFNLFAKTNGEQLPKEEFTVEKTNDNLTQPAQDRFKLLREYAVITAGLFLAALAIYFFMMPSNIIFGSITGLAMVLVHFIPVSVSVMTLNLFCLVIGFVFVGKEFGAKTVYTSLLLPVFLYIFEVLFPNNPSLTNDMTLDALCCVLLISVGQALMFNANASSGGLDIIGKVINKYTHIELGQSIAVVGALTVASSILVYDTKTLVIGFLGTYFNGIVIDSFISGFSRRKRVCIHLSFKQTGDIIGAGDWNINSQFFHYDSILWIIDPCHRFRHLEDSLCQLTGNQIVLVQTGDRDDCI